MQKKPDYTAWHLRNPATGEEYYYLQQPDKVIRVNLRDLRITHADVTHLVLGLRDPGSLRAVTIAQYRRAVRLFWLLLIKHNLISISNLFQIMLKRETFKHVGPKTYLVTTWYLLGLLPVYRTELLRSY